MYRSVSSTFTFCSFRFCEARWVDDRPVADNAIEVCPFRLLLVYLSHIWFGSGKLQEIELVKSKKAKLQESVGFLRKQVDTWMINADKNQNLSALSVATACLQDAKKKEETVRELEQALEHLQREYKRL